MMPMGFYYVGVVLQNYVHENVRFCIMGVHWSVKVGHLKHFCQNWSILKILNAYFTITTYFTPAQVILFQHINKDG